MYSNQAHPLYQYYVCPCTHLPDPSIFQVAFLSLNKKLLNIPPELGSYKSF